MAKLRHRSRGQSSSQIRRLQAPPLLDPLEPRLLLSASPQLWFYVQTNLSVQANVTSTEALIARASAAGYSYMMLDDTKLGYDGILRPNAQNPDFDPTWTYYVNIANVLADAAAHNITIVPSTDEVGRADWIASNINENLIEGQPVIAASFTVSPDGTTLLFNPTNPALTNTSFESGSTGWALNPGRASISTANAHTGTHSLQISGNTPGTDDRGFGIQTITLIPNQEYHVSFWVDESANFSGDELVKIYDPSQGIYIEDHEGDSALAYNTTTGGWQQFNYMFNSGSSTSAQLRLGSWGDTTGTLWYDDVSVTETALVNVVRNASAPLTVTRTNGAVLTEGVDFNPIEAPYEAGVTGLTYATWENPLTVTIPAGSSLKPGDKVNISYSGVQPVYDGQYAITLSDPAVQTYYYDNMVQLRKMFATGTPVMLGGYDEIRAGNTEPGEIAAGLTAAQLLDQNFLATYNTIRAVDPTTPIYTWSDMFDPYHNAVNQYYLWNGNLTPVTPGLPSDVTVMNWNLGDLNQSLKYFAANGNSQIIAGDYGAADGYTEAQTEVAEAVGAANVKGLMFTVWDGDYSQLENYAAGAKAAWAALITPPSVTSVHVSSTAWTPAFLNSLATANLGSSALGYQIPTGPNQLKALPWANLNQISITFSENVTITSAALTVTGLNVLSYSISNFAYNSTTDTATWTLATTIPDDTLQLALPAIGPNAVTDLAGNPLDGEWTNGSSTTSGDGTPGGNFAFTAKILPGDTNGDGIVNFSDFVALSNNFGSPNPTTDFNGDNTTNFSDFVTLSNNFGNQSPVAPLIATATLETTPIPTPAGPTPTANPNPNPLPTTPIISQTPSPTPPKSTTPTLDTKSPPPPKSSPPAKTPPVPHPSPSIPPPAKPAEKPAAPRSHPCLHPPNNPSNSPAHIPNHPDKISKDANPLPHVASLVASFFILPNPPRHRLAHHHRAHRRIVPHPPIINRRIFPEITPHPRPLSLNSHLPHTIGESQMRSSLRQFICSFALAAAVLPALIPQPARADGLVAKDDYFPIGVWCQQPRHAEEYKAIGINLYIALWEGPTDDQLTTLQKAGMPVACEQNNVALDPKWNKEIVAWLQNDEPDNAQLVKGKEGYQPPVLPSVIVDRYQAMKAADKENRPVMLNLDIAVAWDQWPGRGTRTNHPEDYPEYVKGGDVLSFDIYPMSETSKKIAGKMSYVGHGVSRLVKWVDDKKPVFTCIETTRISNPKNMITPEQIRSEVWMAIINGAHGIIYFCHEFKPNQENDAALLARPEIVAAVKKTNAEVQSLARVINTGKSIDTVKVDDKNITLMTRVLNGETYIFASASDPGPIKATFTIPIAGPTHPVEVIGETRTIAMTDGKLTDTFTGYEAHIYHIKPFTQALPVPSERDLQP